MAVFQSYGFLLSFLFGLIPPLPEINGYSHWIVTQHGTIEPISISFYSMRQPWNLLKLFQQENNIDLVQTVEWKLNKVSNDLQINQEYQNHIQKYYVDSDSACVKATKLLSEFDLHSTHILTLEAKGINSLNYLNENLFKSISGKQDELQQPMCDAFFNRSFSMCCFDHLEALRNRYRYEGVPEMSLYKIAFPQHMTPAEYGHLVWFALIENHLDSTKNWIFFNMAAFYWRVKGVASRAIDCLRAALHTSPFNYLDVALVSLVNILNLVKTATNDAIILMQNAVIISPQFSSHHIILGNMFASIGEFNKSLYHYRKAAKFFQAGEDKIKLQDIEDRIFAARCSFELSSAIVKQQLNLDKQMRDLELFQRKTAFYKDAKLNIEVERANNATQKKIQWIYESYVNTEEEKESMLTDNCMFDSDREDQMPCLSHENAFLMKLIKYNSSTSMTNKLETNFIPIKSDDSMEPLSPRRYRKLHSDAYSFRVDDITSRINKKYCSTIKCFNYDDKINSKNLFSIFLSPRNKGLEIQDILSKKQGLTSSQEHPLPWYPPICSLYINKSELRKINVVDSLETLKQKHTFNSNIDPNKQDKTLLQELGKFVENSNLRLEEIGQRIVTALKKQLAPVWIVLNIAGLYWRILGNTFQAVDCFHFATKMTPQNYADISMVNLAGVLVKANKTKDALKLIKAALQVDFSEPETHLLAAVLYFKNEKFYLAHHHLEIAINQEPNLELVAFDKNFIVCKLCHKFRSEQMNEFGRSRIVNLRSNITAIFMKHRMCNNVDECNYIVSNNLHFSPHVRVSIKGSTLSSSDIAEINSISSEGPQRPNFDRKVETMYGFLWNTNLSNLHIQENDCLVTNDSIKSVGCHLNDNVFSASEGAVRFLDELRTFLSNVSHTAIEGHSSQISNEKHICKKDQMKTSSQMDHSTVSSFLVPVNVQDDIVSLISSRVVVNPLAPEDCEHVGPFDFKAYTPLYVSLDTMQVDIVSLVDSFTPGYSFSFNQQPYCQPKTDNFLHEILEKYKVDFGSSSSKVPEYNLHNSLMKAFKDKYSIEEIGRRLYTGLDKNPNDWRLSTVAVNYWRIYGDAHNAFNCLEIAAENSPDFHQKIVLVNAANILYRINQFDAALEVSYRALQYPDGKNWVIIPFLVANIFGAMQQWQKATMFYEACLSLKADFDEALNRIKSIQCQQIVLQNLEQH